MQVTETSSEGLKRELRVVVDASELDDKLSSRLEELKNQVQIKGFRPGKVPVAHLRRVYGRQVMSEILQKTVAETSQEAIEQRNERPAMQPDIQLAEDGEDMEKVIKGEADLSYTLSFEILPDIDVTALSEIRLEKPVAEVPDEEIDQSIDNLLDNGTTYEAEDGRVATDGDRVTVDFVGRIDGEAFEGGTAEDVQVVLGKGGFIPGFEEGLEGAKAGEEREVKTTFPEAYPVEHLAGKEAVFEANVKEVAKPVRPELDDAFAQSLGLESVEKLREAIASRLKEEYGKAARAKLKRTLLDKLDEHHDFELPPGLVEQEFEGIWNEMTQEMEQANRSFEDEGKTEEGAREECRKLAERRVRVGLVLSEVGEKNEIRVNEDELNKAIFEQARQYPGQEQQVFEYFRQNPGAATQLRAPIYEDKVVDFILELAKVEEKPVSREELFASDDEEDNEDGASSTA